MLDLSKTEYPFFKFDCSDKRTNGRILQGSDFPLELVNWECVLIGVRKGVKAIVEVKEVVNSYTIVIMVKDITTEKGSTSGKLIPLRRIINTD